MTNIKGNNGFFWSKRYSKELFLALFIFFLPFLIFIHVLFKDGESQTLNIFGFSFHHGYYGSNIYIWILLGSVIPLTLLLVWFFVTRYKWKYLIFLPMSIFMRTVTKMMFGGLLKEYDIHVSIPIMIWMGILIVLDIVFFKKDKKRILLENTFEHYLNLKSKFFYNTLNQKLYGIRNKKKERGFSYYLKNIYYIKTLLNNRQIKHGFSKLSSFKLQNKTIHWYVCISLIGVYFFYRLHYLMEKGVMELDLGFWVMGSYGFIDYHIFFWFFSRKLAILLSLCVWYSISRNWWKYAMLSPIFLYTYQIWEMLQGTKAIEEWGNIRVLPIIVLVFLALTFISRTMRYESKIMDVQEQIVDEIEELLQGQEDEDRVQKDKFALERLRKEVASNDAKQQQLDALLSLKRQLEDRLLEK